LKILKLKKLGYFTPFLQRSTGS